MGVVTGKLLTEDLQVGVRIITPFNSSYVNLDVKQITTSFFLNILPLGKI